MNVELGPIQETLLIPLLGRARETQRDGGLIHDPKAVEIVEQLDYDFSKWERAPSLKGATVRTRMYDHEAGAFLREYPSGTIVEIGCGLNTRYERLDNGMARWFDLDLPDTIALRREFFEDSERRTMIAKSVLDTSWHEQVLKTGGPWLFLSEAVLIYLDAPRVEHVIRQLAQIFTGSTLVMDTAGKEMVDGQATHDVMSKLGQESWFRWACDDPGSLASWGLGLKSSKSFVDASADIIADLPWVMRVAVRLVPGVFRRKLKGYSINTYQLAQPMTGDAS